ncbi:MAG TPA: ABC transporter ATP-binding protein, partial [Candidatus Bathyarchaeota archaeon]|nr:ABC transporter ATP-binding protein [Candidatus Bathyarchaeota archaeon]
MVSQRAGYEIRMDMYNSLLEKSFSFYDRQKTGQLMARATGDINMLGRFINFGFRMSVSNLLLVLMVLYSMASISPRLTGLALVFIAVLLATTTRYSRMIRPLWQAIRELYGEVTSVVQESLAGIRVVKGFHRESYEEKRFKGVAQRYFDVTLKSVRLRSFYRPLVSLISEVGSIVLLVYGG